MYWVNGFLKTIVKQHSKIHNNIPLHKQSKVNIHLQGKEVKGQVKKGGEERIMEAFTHLSMLLKSLMTTPPNFLQVQYHSQLIKCL